MRKAPVVYRWRLWWPGRGALESSDETVKWGWSSFRVLGVNGEMVLNWGAGVQSGFGGDSEFL